MNKPELLQELAEQQSIDSRVVTAILAFEVILIQGASEHLPADFPAAVLNMAKNSLLRMEARQERFDLDKKYTIRSQQKIAQAYSYIHSRQIET